MAKNTHRVVGVYALDGFLCSMPSRQIRAIRTERQTKDLFMATRPNRESALVWRKSRVSGESGGCVEMALSNSSVLVRDSRDHPGATLTFSPAQWRQFVHRIKSAKTHLG
jgi:hypothetical protein